MLFNREGAAMIGSDIVVSGLSCRLPESDSADEFWQNLIQGVDMVTEDDRRFPAGYAGLPRRFGKIKDPTRFDAGFFGVHAKQAEKMDPQLRMLLEVSFEAFLDAGILPEELRGSNAGVFIGACFSDANAIYGSAPDELTGYENTGCSMAMFANRLSFFYDFHGPSQTIDTACSSSLVAFDAAVRAIRTGQCDLAIVGGTNLVHRPSISIGFAKLQMLSPTGACKAFDQGADGYARADGVSAVIVCRADIARRSCATVLGTGTNSDGFTAQGITFPNREMQARLLRDVYREAGIDPQDVAWVEAHGTGTQAGDPEEVGALVDAFEPQRRGPGRPLLIGSVKTNAGHSEGGAALIGMIKVLLSIRHGGIPANLHFDEPNPNIPALLDGTVRVVDENLPWDGGIVGINSFGFGGANAHVILSGSPSPDREPSAPMESATFLPVSGRSEQAVRDLIERLRERTLSPEVLSFFRTIAEIDGFRVRGGFTVTEAGPREPIVGTAPAEPPPVYFVFPGMGSQWPHMARDLMADPGFRSSIETCTAALADLEDAFDITDLIESDDPEVFATATRAFVGITAVQTSLVDHFRSMGIFAAGFIGHSVGEIACAYADGGLTREQAVLAAYHRGACVEAAPEAWGSMAAVERSWDHAKALEAEGITAACHNSSESVTMSGPTAAIRAMVAELEARGEGVHLVDSSGIAFHSKGVRAAAPALGQALREIIPSPGLRTDRWISTSRPKSEWPDARSCSAEYFVDNLTNPVLFAEALAEIPAGAVVVEMGPHSLMRASVLDIVPDCRYVHAMRRDFDNRIELQNALGRCYADGVRVDWFSGSDPPQEFDAGLDVPSISLWDHSRSWPLADLGKDILRSDRGQEFTYDIDLDSEEYAFIVDHRLGGRALFPGVGYLWLVWRTLGRLADVPYEELAVSFEDVRFRQAVMISPDGPTRLNVSWLSGSGSFEVLEGGEVVASGTARYGEGVEVGASAWSPRPGGVRLTGTDLYRELRLRGYEYGDQFRTVEEVASDASTMRIAWRRNWVTFLDGLLQASSIRHERRLLVPTSIRRVVIDPTLQPDEEVLEAHFEPRLSRIRSAAVQLDGLDFKPLSMVSRSEPVVSEVQFFSPLDDFDPVGDDDRGRALDHMTKAYVVHQVRDILARSRAEGRTLPAHVERIGELFAPLSLQRPDEAEVERRADEPDSVLLRLARFVFSQPDALLTDPLSLILSFDEYARIYKDSRSAAVLLNPWHVGAMLDLVMENNGIGDTFRVAEVGAGTGGMTHQVLPKLRGRQDRYILTDITSGFFDGLRNQFEAYDPVTDYVVWDILDPVPDAVGDPLHLIVASNVIHAAANIRRALSNVRDALDEGGFFLLHEITDGWIAVMGIWGFIEALWDFEDPEDRSFGACLSNELWVKVLDECGFDIISRHADGLLQMIYLCRKRASHPMEVEVVEWVDPATSLGEVQRALATAAERRDRTVWIAGNQRQAPGLTGLSNCARFEPDGELLRTIYFADADGEGTPARVADLPAEEWESLRRRDLAMNVRKRGVWGTYRVAKTESRPAPREHEHVTLATGIQGDLSTLHWADGPRSPDADFVCDVHFAAVNFKDVMLATDRLSMGVASGALASMAGEFSGIGRSGARLMGCAAGALTSRVYYSGGPAGLPCLWHVPDAWTLEDAATVPIVYATAYLALIVRAGLRTGQRILIHSGSGGVGQAAIRLAHSLDCEIFTTVGTPAKRRFLREAFPFIPDSHIGNSRDTSFEELVMEQTGGRGVDVVLNSLADDKLQASIRVLARYGRFVEIGKYDMTVDTPVGMAMFLRDISFCGVGLDNYSVDGHETLRQVTELVEQGIRDGVVQPLPRTVFGHDEVESAFRFMAQGKHVGKVMVRMKDVPESPAPARVRARPRFSCDPEKSYLVTGGLGGFGFELAGWLVQRGAKHLVLSSRGGVKDGYQRYRIAGWERQGVDVVVSQGDVSTAEGARSLVEAAQRRAPLAGIFHLAMVMRDALLPNQTVRGFEEVVAVKFEGAHHLDEITRASCPHLEQFVTFSSLAAGRGNPGQSSYGYANAALDRLCEARRRDGFPGLSIEWGAIGDVGFVHENRDVIDIELLRTKEQPLASCLEMLDACLHGQAPVRTSYILYNDILERRDDGAGVHEGEARTLEDLYTDVRNILGLQSDEQIAPATPLVDIGLDSLMAVEIKNKLQRDYGIYLSQGKIREISFASLRDLFEERHAATGSGDGVSEESARPEAPAPPQVTGPHEHGGGRNGTGPAAVPEDHTASSDGRPDLFSRIASADHPISALYFVGGLAADPLDAVSAVPIPVNSLAFVVHFERGGSMRSLAHAWAAHMGDLPPSVDAVRVIGFSTGALIVHRLQAEFEEHPAGAPGLDGLRLQYVSVSPPRPDVLLPFGAYTVDDLEHIGAEDGMGLLRSIPPLAAINTLEPEILRAQVRFLLTDELYRQQLGRVDLTILPEDDPFTWDREHAHRIAAEVRLVPGKHDLKDLPLAEVLDGVLAGGG
jgi:fatty acid synthase, animal type